MQCGFCDSQHLGSIIFQTPRTSVWTLSKDRRPVPEVKCKKCPSLQMLGRSRKGCPQVCIGCLITEYMEEGNNGAEFLRTAVRADVGQDKSKSGCEFLR